VSKTSGFISTIGLHTIKLDIIFQLVKMMVMTPDDFLRACDFQLTYGTLVHGWQSGLDEVDFVDFFFFGVVRWWWLRIKRGTNSNK
jgi:hypothetical protein